MSSALNNNNNNDDDNDKTLTFHIVGDAYVDFFCFLDGEWPENGGDSRLDQPVKSYAGGSSTNTATHLKSCLKHFNTSLPPPKVNLHTVLNPEDHYGQLLLKHAEEHQFPIINCRKEEDTSSTGHCIAIVSGGERSFMTHQGCVGKFSASDVDMKAIASTPTHIHLHVAGFFNIPGFWAGKLKRELESIRESRKQGGLSDKNTTISLVTQHDAGRGWDGGIDEIIPLLDFCIMNHLEAKNIVLRGQRVHGHVVLESDDEIQNWATYFNTVSPTSNIIVTRGKQGAVVLRGGKVIADQAAIIVKPVDPTGAGDSFTAGFLHGIWSWKLKGDAKDYTSEWPIEAIEEGLRWGCAMGSSAIMIRGASVPAKPEDVLKFHEQALKVAELN
jgi:sugar/nucleoside kinase (ribokinase family)